MSDFSIGDRVEYSDGEPRTGTIRNKNRKGDVCVAWDDNPDGADAWYASYGLAPEGTWAATHRATNSHGGPVSCHGCGEQIETRPYIRVEVYLEEPSRGRLTRVLSILSFHEGCPVAIDNEIVAHSQAKP